MGLGSRCSAQPEDGEVAPKLPTFPIEEVRISAECTTSISLLDTVNLEEVFRHRALLMRSPPAFLIGAYRSAMRLALGELDSARHSNDPARSIRASTTSSLSSTTRRIGAASDRDLRGLPAVSGSLC